MNLSLKGFQGLSAPAKAHPAFVAHAFDQINLSTAFIYIYLSVMADFQSSRINGREKLEISLKGFHGPSTHFTLTFDVLDV